MATMINGVSRYNTPAKLTSFVDFEKLGNGTGYEIVQFSFLADSVTQNFVAPADGKLVAVKLVSATTTTGSHKIGLVITNESNSDAAMLAASTLYDDDPVATADVAVDVPLNATAANLVVEAGDRIQVAYTETGTIAGGAVALYFVPNSMLEHAS